MSGRLYDFDVSRSVLTLQGNPTSHPTSRSPAAVAVSGRRIGECRDSGSSGTDGPHSSARARYLAPALADSPIEPTIPDKPNSRLQKYRLTAKGTALLATMRTP